MRLPATAALLVALRTAALIAAGLFLLCGCASLAPGASSPGPAQGDAPAGGASGGTANTPPRFGAQELERAVHRAANRARQERGRAPLAWSDSLRRLARGHSADMAERDYFSHTTPEGVGPAGRARRLGFPAFRPLGDEQRIGVAENLFRTYRYAGYRDRYRQREGEPRQRTGRTYDRKGLEAVARETVQNWLDSPAHRRALLSRDYRQQGLGVAITQERIYVTQNLF